MEINKMWTFCCNSNTLRHWTISLCSFYLCHSLLLPKYLCPKQLPVWQHLEWGRVFPSLSQICPSAILFWDNNLQTRFLLRLLHPEIHFFTTLALANIKQYYVQCFNCSSAEVISFMCIINEGESKFHHNATIGVFWKLPLVWQDTESFIRGIMYVNYIL